MGLAGLALLPLAIHQEGAGRPNSFTSIPVLERLLASLAKFVAGEGESTSGKWSAMPPLGRGFGLVGLACFAVAIAGVFALGERSERRGALAIGAVALASLAVPVGLALGGIDYIEPRNLLGSLVPLFVLVAAGVDVWCSASSCGRRFLFAPPFRSQSRHRSRPSCS